MGHATSNLLGSYNENKAHRPEETVRLHANHVRLPLTDAGGGLGHRGDPMCLDFELRFLDCAEAYGPIIGEQKCKLLFQDFQECSTKWKQFRRIQHIRQERTRQFIKGALGLGPKMSMWEESPDQDSYPVDSYDETEPTYWYYSP